MASWIVHLRIGENLPGLFPDLDRLVDESTRKLSRIYQHLWINGAAMDGFVSALDLMIYCFLLD
jgi:hypothetical protein